jgi:predicted ribosome quality control (RQC) complex YloA/Tae2 family protein
MKITLDFNKSVDENASSYFEKAKKSRKKLVGTKTTLEKFENEKANEKIETNTKKLTKLENKNSLWFDKFKWFVSSDGYLIIAGRDATTNEIIIKKHTETKDLVFHTDMAGSPFAIIKFDSKDVKLINDKLKVPKFETIPEQTIKETAAFVALHSRSWKLGLGNAKVFYVSPEQVSKEANPGEFMAKGSFMIRGKTNYVSYDFEFGLGVFFEKVICGPIIAVQTHSKTVVQILQGNDKASEVARKIKSTFREKENLDLSPDDIIKTLPSGGCEVKKERIKKY